MPEYAEDIPGLELYPTQVREFLAAERERRQRARDVNRETTLAAT